MIALIVETSTERSVTALYRDGVCLSTFEFPFGLTSSKFLLPELSLMLKQCGLTVRDLNWIAVGRGPGSYTGIRVGAVVGKTLSYACKIPLIGVCSMSGFILKEEGRFASVFDAKIGGVYFRVGEKKKGGVLWDGKSQVLPLKEAGKILESVNVLVTPYQNNLKSRFAFLNGSWSWIERVPDTQAIYEEGKKRFEVMDYSVDGYLELSYLRKTQAEIEK